MNALAGQCIEIGRQGGHQGLALAGTHLRNLAFVQDHATHELDIEVPHAQDPTACLAADGKGLHEQRVDGGAVLRALTKLGGLGNELGVGELLKAGL